MAEAYDFVGMGQQYAEDFYKDSSKFADRLEKDFGEVAKIKFQYGMSKRMAEVANSVFEESMKEASTVTRRTPKKQTTTRKRVSK